MKRECGAAVADRVGAGDRLVDARAVARVLDISDRSVWKMAAGGRLPAAVRVGRSVKWRLSDIQRFIEVGCDIREFEARRVS